jgi:hypothetical protein
MYRGSSFLLSHAHTVHRAVIDTLAQRRFLPLWGAEFDGADAADLVPLTLDAAGAIRASYQPFSSMVGSLPPTDTLVTKVILGTLGCLPACDRYFISGFKRAGFAYSYLNRPFIERVVDFCCKNRRALRAEQARIERRHQCRYPLMKLVDMHFWQLGFDGGGDPRDETT